MERRGHTLPLLWPRPPQVSGEGKDGGEEKEGGKKLEENEGERREREQREKTMEGKVEAEQRGER